MTWLLGPAASLIGGALGSKSAGDAAKKQYKATKLQAQTAANQLNFAKDIYGTEQGIAASTLPQQTAAIQTGLTGELGALRAGEAAGAGALTSGRAGELAALQQAQGQGIGALGTGQTQGIGALGAGQTQAINALAGNQALQQGIYDPYMQQGTASVNALTSTLGLNPQGGEAGYNAFLDSPLYRAMVAPALASAERETTRRFAGTGQAGAVGQALQDRLAEVGGRGFGQYQAGLESAAGRGLQATGQYGDISGRNALASAGIYGDTAARQASLYGDTAARQASLYGDLGARMGSAYGDTAARLGQLYGESGARLGSAYGTAGRATSDTLGDYLRTRAGLASGLSGAAATGFGNIINAQGASGAAQAAGQLGAGNAWGNAFNSIAQNLGQNTAPGGSFEDWLARQPWNVKG